MTSALVLEQQRAAAPAEPSAAAGEAPAPRASVLIPLYNSAATIERAVRSALAQSLANIEVIVADDASTDDGAAKVAALAAADPRLRLIRLPRNSGKPHAMNLMVAQAKGEWLAVLDADDAYHVTRLEQLIDGAEAAGTDMAADNLGFIDSGMPGKNGGFGQIVRFGFDPARGDGIVTKSDMLRDSSSFADFDYGVLKPVIRRAFVQKHRLAYDETSRLAEDFSYLLLYFVAGGRLFLSARATYDWTMPFGALSRQWTQTGAGPWRYDYRPAIVANNALIARMQAHGETEVVAMLRRRGRQYRVMVHYIAAQRHAESRRYGAAIRSLLRHPGTFGLLARRVAGRLKRGWR
jgi:glycosyltransferase involved in cell wall biosynthesis